MRAVTCATPGCTNQHIPIILPDNGTDVVCGACGRPISNIQALEGT